MIHESAIIICLREKNRIKNVPAESLPANRCVKILEIRNMILYPQKNSLKNGNQFYYGSDLITANNLN